MTEIEINEEKKVRVEAYKSSRNKKYYDDTDKLFDNEEAAFDDIFKTFKQMQDLAKVSNQHYDVIVTFSTDLEKEYF